MKVEVIHELPGRTRLRVWTTLLSIPHAERLADALTAVQGVTKAEINRRTGGILVSHAPAVSAADLLASARATIASLPTDGWPDLPDETQGVTSIARALHRLFVDADHDLREKTHGMLDLGTATTLTMLTAGALEIAVTEKLPIPPWFNLAWWSFRTFMTTIEDRATEAPKASPLSEPAKGSQS